MSRRTYSRHEQPLHSSDLRICHKVFQAVCGDLGVEVSAEESDRIAAITVELYQQGVRDEQQLRILVDAARGITFVLGTHKGA